MEERLWKTPSNEEALYITLNFPSFSLPGEIWLFLTQSSIIYVYAISGSGLEAPVVTEEEEALYDKRKECWMNNGRSKESKQAKSLSNLMQNNEMLYMTNGEIKGNFWIAHCCFWFDKYKTCPHTLIEHINTSLNCLSLTQLTDRWCTV